MDSNLKKHYIDTLLIWRRILDPNFL